MAGVVTDELIKLAGQAGGHIIRGGARGAVGNYARTGITGLCYRIIIREKKAITYALPSRVTWNKRRHTT